MCLVHLWLKQSKIRYSIPLPGDTAIECQTDAVRRTCSVQTDSIICSPLSVGK